MRRAASLAAAVLLAGCGAEQVEEPLPDAAFDPHWTGGVAVSDDYRIQATFPDDQPVCLATSGTHIHGFYQWRGGDCADPAEETGHFISVYADYNAAGYGWDEAAALRCGADSEPFDLGVEATGAGRLSACVPRLCGEQYVITAVYLSPSPVRQSGEAASGDGPALIYWIALGTSTETQAADLSEFRTFLSQLRLDGGGFAVSEG